MKFIATLLTLCCLLTQPSPQLSFQPLSLTYAALQGFGDHTDKLDSTVTLPDDPDTANAQTPENSSEAAHASKNSTTKQSPENSGTAQNPENSGEAQNPENSGTAQDPSSGSQAPAAPALNLETPSAILIESTTGTVIYEKDSHKKLRPASITKVMTLLLIFEAIDKGKIHLDDVVTVSEHAASMGGSQVFLEQGEQQSVQELIKCISIASANDACVAMAEFVGGSEDAFVAMMNDRARELGMADTTFVNSCGLEAEGHLTSANDISLMARELTLYHPEIFDYCTIWMDTITHKTARGESEFGLTNTNKLIRYYSYATGLKTGYTSQSKYCLAATATRDDVDLIAVVMAEPTPTQRTKEAISLLDYGFANCRIYSDSNRDLLPAVPVRKGTEEQVELEYQKDFSYVILDGSATDTVEKSIELPEELPAPIAAGTEVGSVIYTKDGTEIGRVPILAAGDVAERSFSDCLLKNLAVFFEI